MEKISDKEKIYVITPDNYNVLGPDDDEVAIIDKFEGYDNIEFDEIEKIVLPNEIFFKGPFDVLEATDFPMCDPWWPIMSKKMLEILLSVRNFFYKTFPLTFLDTNIDMKQPSPSWDYATCPRSHDFIILQLTEHLDIMNYEESIYKRSKLPTKHIRRIEKLVLNEPQDGFPPIFRVNEISLIGYLFISAEARTALEKAGIKGIKYKTLDEKFF